MAFLTEAPPQRGVALPVAPGVRRIVAGNPGPMTYHGTNTYLIDAIPGITRAATVLDPGPDEPAHRAAILDAAAGQVGLIILTHGHADHAAGAAALRAATGAPVAAFAGATATPDLPLRGGDHVVGLEVLHMPGHAADHLCLVGRDGVLFSGDHVMSWASSAIIPPDGDMAAYMAGLLRLLRRDDRLYLPGHGPPLPEPRALVAELLAHRQAREAEVLAALADQPRDEATLLRAIYPDLAPGLTAAAVATLQAHLRKLAADGQVVGKAGRWRITAG